MAETMIYRRLADGETVKDMHTTSEGNFEYRIVDLASPDDPIPDGWSRSLDDAPAPKKNAKKAKVSEPEPTPEGGE